MAYERIHTSLSKGIETITLDYGPTLNALDMVMAGELAEALEEAEGNPEVKVLVLAGAGRAAQQEAAHGHGLARRRRYPVYEGPLR